MAGQATRRREERSGREGHREREDPREVRLEPGARPELGALRGVESPGMSKNRISISFC